MKYKILDNGFVELIDKLGDDLTIVNSARVSYGKRKKKFEEEDKKLLNFLAKNKHYSPFRHAMMQFHIKWPEMVARQGYKHIVGIEITSSNAYKDHAWNEISGRYIKYDDFYYPDIWRKQSKSSKQGSSGKIEDEITHTLIKNKYKQAVAISVETYEYLLEKGVAKEQARGVLPLNLYTECYWTASFQAVMHFIDLRNKSDAQWEIREYANVLDSIVKKIYPNTYIAWINKA